MEYLKKVWKYKYLLLITTMVAGLVTTLSISRRYIPQRYEAKVEFRLNSKLSSGILTERGDMLMFDANGMRRLLRNRGEMLTSTSKKNKVIVTLDGSNKYTILTRSVDPKSAYTITSELFEIAKTQILTFTRRTPFGHQMDRHEKYVEVLENGISVMMYDLKSDSAFIDKQQLLNTAYKHCMDTIATGLQNIEPTESPITILYKTPYEEIRLSTSPYWYIFFSMSIALVIGFMVVLLYGKK